MKEPSQKERGVSLLTWIESEGLTDGSAQFFAQGLPANLLTFDFIFLSEAGQEHLLRFPTRDGFCMRIESCESHVSKLRVVFPGRCFRPSVCEVDVIDQQESEWLNDDKKPE